MLSTLTLVVTSMTCSNLESKVTGKYNYMVLHAGTQLVLYALFTSLVCTGDGFFPSGEPSCLLSYSINTYNLKSQ